MIYFNLLACVITSLVVKGNGATHNEKTLRQLEQVQSPTLEVLMYLPSNFHNIKAFENSFDSKPEQLTGQTEAYSLKKRNLNLKNVVDVRTYEIARPVPQNQAAFKRNKREAEPSNSHKNLSPESQALASPFLIREFANQGPEHRVPSEDAVRGPIYSKHSVKEFDVVDLDDPDDPRRRRNDSSDREDDSQRDKRTFPGGVGEKESTTANPFWKRKKENPPFVTGRGGSIQTGSSYIPAQHRSAENARESHSLKNLDKSLQSNEISRSNQDNFYSATNRKTYGRQTDNISFSTPKSVYDTINYNEGKKSQGTEVRNEAGRHREEKKETLRDGRVTHEEYYNRQYYNHPSGYDRSFYHPPYPYPTEVLSRGVEYYHRTYDPSSGRIIYYATLPDQVRPYDNGFFDPVNRNFYVNYRPYYYEPYYRNYVPPNDYRFPSGFVRPDYTRAGRSNSQAYSYPFSDKRKYSRNSRFDGTSGPISGESRNKTYVIYDAEDRPANSLRTSDFNGFFPMNQGFSFGGSQAGNRNFVGQFPTGYSLPPAFSFRNQFHSLPSNWGLNDRFKQGLVNPEMNQRTPHAPDVQLPLTASHRGIRPSEDVQQPKKP